MPEIHSIGGKRYTVSTNGGDVHLVWVDDPARQEGDALFVQEEALKLIRALTQATLQAQEWQRIYDNTYEGWVDGLIHYTLNNPTQRRGQAAYNFLVQKRPDLVESINDTDYDPFYNDDRLFAFHEKVQEMWTTTEESI